MAFLDKSDRSTALYLQLTAYLRERIQDGTFPPGTCLPTEMELAETHEISRNTVRQAMSTLVHEGLLERVRGRGTFVCPLPDNSFTTPAAEKRIGVVLMYAADQLNMELLMGIDQAAKSRGYQVSFAYSEESPAQQFRDIARLRADRVAGMVIFPVSNEPDSPAIAQLQASGVPVVLIDRYLANRTTDYVVPDNYAGGYRATEHLLILGHTRIGFIGSGYLRTTSVRDRWQGYQAALLDHKLPYDENLVFTCPLRPEETTIEIYLPFLARLDRPSAVFVSTDLQVPALLQAAGRSGLRVPEDLAIVSFDDLSFASHLTPPLTTVAQLRVEIGLRATHLLINRIEGDNSPPKQIVVPTNLVIRESCGARRQIQQSVSKSVEAKT